MVTIEPQPKNTTERIPFTGIEQSILVNGEALKELPKDLYIPPKALEVFLDTFQGPLDLLLYLIRRQNLDILDIPVAKITEQYLQYIEMMTTLRLDLAADYLLMAAMLAEIKSRLLVPRPKNEEDNGELIEDPRAALVQQLQAYERFRQAAKEMDEMPRMERDFYLVEAKFNDHDPQPVLSEASLNELVSAFRRVLERNVHNKNWVVDRDTLTLREKMTVILDRVQWGQRLEFTQLFDPNEGKAGLVVSFMAILELMREGLLQVIQEAPFAAIHISSR
jgi:segregation and condensation protein A